MDIQKWVFVLGLVALALLAFGSAFGERFFFILSAIAATVAAVLYVVSGVT